MIIYLAISCYDVAYNDEFPVLPNGFMSSSDFANVEMLRIFTEIFFNYSS